MILKGAGDVSYASEEGACSRGGGVYWYGNSYDKPGTYNGCVEACSWKITVVCSSAWEGEYISCLLYTSPSPRDRTRSRMPSSA